MPDALPRPTLADAFRALGLARSDSLILHSSYRAIGPVEGGPAGVVDALLDVIGGDGNLMLPTFNYFRPAPDPYFDPAATPCRTGIIPELGRQRPDAVRSLQPSHSVAVIGPRAEELTRDHLAFRTVGKGSPIDRLAKLGGKVLLLGVDHRTNTTIHVAEEYADIPKGHWQDPPPVGRMLMPDGRVVEHVADTSTSCSTAFDGAEYILRRHSCIRDLRVGTCKLQLVAGEDIVRHVSALLRDEPDVLLCTNPNCAPCTFARAALT